VGAQGICYGGCDWKLELEKVPGLPCPSGASTVLYRTLPYRAVLYLHGHLLKVTFVFFFPFLSLSFLLKTDDLRSFHKLRMWSHDLSDRKVDKAGK